MKTYHGLTREQLIERFADARAAGIKKWEVARDTGNEDTECRLCECDDELHELGFSEINCGFCPLYSPDTIRLTCCLEYEAWRRKNSPQNAQSVIDRIAAIDPEAWVDKLIAQEIEDA